MKYLSQTPVRTWFPAKSSFRMCWKLVGRTYLKEVGHQEYCPQPIPASGHDLEGNYHTIITWRTSTNSSSVYVLLQSSSSHSHRKVGETGEMTQWFKVSAVPPEYPDSIMALTAEVTSSSRVQPTSDSCGHQAHTLCTCPHADKAPINIK